MSLLISRAGLLSHAIALPPSVDIGDAIALDAARRPSGYTLSNANQTAINTSGGANYLRWVPATRAVLPLDGRRYWEVACAQGGAAIFDGFFGLIAATQLFEWNAGIAPAVRGSIGRRGTGGLWSNTTTTLQQRITGLPTYGAGDILMLAFDPALSQIWLGKNGIWHTDPVSGAPVFTAPLSPAFYPYIHGRNIGDGGTLRSLPSQFSYPIPQTCRALGQLDAGLTVLEAAAFCEIGWDAPLSIAEAAIWAERGGSSALNIADASLYIEYGSNPYGVSLSAASLYIERGSHPAGVSLAEVAFYIELETT